MRHPRTVAPTGEYRCDGCPHADAGRCKMTANPLPSHGVTPTWCPILPKSWEPLVVLRQTTAALRHRI